MTWIFWLFIITPFLCDFANAQNQRIAPGVPPQHYQQQQMQQVPQQQMHHQQIPSQQQVHHQQQPQYQPAPVQQQQHVPVQHQQQQHVPVQQQQQPHQQHQPHHHDHQPQQLLNPTNIAHEKEHIAEHFDVPIDTSKMTEQELQFHYFKMHDADNNNKLDGCELIKSLIHWHEQGSKDPQHGATAGDKLFKDDEFVALIDPILNTDDANYDGFIDYPEFIQAQQKAAASGARQH